MASASDVPGKYDLVVDSQGYLLLDALAPNIPFRTHRAIYTSSPTFLERSNVSGSYGDNQQDFWLTASQNDWSGGDTQLFWRSSDKDVVKARRYYVGSNINTSVEGEATLNGKITTLAFGASDTPNGVCAAGTGRVYAMSPTHLYSIGGSTVTDLGAHGALSVDSLAALCSDGTYVYIGGGTKIRSFNIDSSTFADFSSTPAKSMCVIANTLFGISGGQLLFYDTSGTASTAYTWEDAKGGTKTFGFGMKIRPFGGQVVVLREGGVDGGPQLWTADTTGAQQVAQFPRSFAAEDIAVAQGIVFVAGFGESSTVSLGSRSQVWYYANGNIGLLYNGSNYTTGAPGHMAICDFRTGVLFTNAAPDVGSSSGTLVYYDLATGASSTVGNYTSPGITENIQIASGAADAVMTTESTSGYLVTDTTAASSGYISSSLFDFDSSLPKYFRGITVEFESATDGNGGSVDISYQVDSLLGSYTSLQTGAVSGTEYTLSGVSGKNISVKVTLNKGTSTLGPRLKRIYVRAAPVLQSFKNREYIVDLTGAPATPDAPPRTARDGTPYALIPHDAVANLITTIQTAAPVSITDRFGTFTGVVEPSTTEIYEMHAENELPNKVGSYVVKIVVREV